MHDETMPKQAHKVAHFCSMKIIQDVRDYAASHEFEDISLAVEEGMKKKAEEFKAKGSGIY